MKVGIVAEGGGTKAAYSAGVLKCFLEHDILLPYCVGISAASELLLPYASRQAERLYVTGVGATCQKDVVGIRPFLKEGNIFGLDATVNYIEEHAPFDWETFNKTTTEVKIGLYNMETHEAEYYTNEDLDPEFELAKASCALLILCRPRTFKKKKYMDVGLIEMISIDQSIKDGCDKHIVISTKEEGYVRKPAPKWQLWLANLLYHNKTITENLRRRHERYNEQWAKVSALEKEGKALVLRPHKDLGITRYTTDEKLLAPWFQLGYDETLARLDEIKKFCELD
ncbi:MAG: patatin family protein [Firmicutes bacterium]|nr:patatin family protein [Bacillota bacterium]